jgi:hypothetical protein
MMTSPSNKEDAPQRDFIEICDWESFQYSGSHRKPNAPWPWFRLHNNFIESQTWFSMTKPQRSDFVTLLSLVSRFGNMIPKDEKWLRSHGISSKTLPSLAQLPLIRSFSLPADDKRIKQLRSVLSGGLPPRGEENRGEDKREDAPERIPTPGVNDSNHPAPEPPHRTSLSDFLGNQTGKSPHHDPRSFDELKLIVKPHVERFGDDPETIHRLAGPSLQMSHKQIAECVRQLVNDCEVTLPVKPLALQ